MAEMRIGIPSFDRGIDSIAYASKETGHGRLPDLAALTPTAEGVRTRLSELLDQPNISGFLADALRPAMTNRELLAPARFHQVLTQAIAELTAVSRTIGTETGNPDKRVIDRAIRLLDEEVGLRTLVAMYRSALYQG